MPDLISVSEADGTMLCVGYYDSAQATADNPGKTITNHGNIEIPVALAWTAGDSPTCSHKISGGAIVTV